jgi:chromosome segregation ATPase
MTFNLDLIKKASPYLAFLAALVAVILAVRVMSVTDRYSVLKGEYNAKVEQATEAEKYAAGQIAALKTEITLRDTAIVKAQDRIKALTLAGAAASGHLSDLQAEYAKIMEMGGDKDSQITNLNAQIDTWAARFSLSESASAEKDKIIFGLQEKYSAQLSISASWESQFKAERVLRFDAEKLIRSLEWKVRAVRAKSTVMTLATVMIGGLLAHDAIFPGSPWLPWNKKTP